MTGGADLLSFLANFRPDGYTTFVSIVPDGPTSAATFNGGDPEATARWISRANRRGENVYFTANPTPPDTRRKPTKEGIAAVGAMWADLDPRDDGGHSWADERTRLHALSDELQGRRHPPTLTIDSGNGLQPIWLLEDAIEATPEYRGAADALCARIEAALGAKGTHNVDRLLRVPGTDNFPNRKKLGLGRGKTSSRLLHATWQRYSWRDLEDLAADLEDEPPLHAVPTSPEHRGNAAAGAAGASGGGPRSGLDPEELEELRRSLTGENASGWLTAMLRVIGRLVRDGASDWFIKDWALQYRWPEYTEEQTLREIEPMIAGARRKHFDVGFTEDELALEFTRRHRHELRYVAAWSAWMRWTGLAWRKETTLEAYDLARAVCRDIGAGLDNTKLRARILSASARAAVENLARSDRAHAAVTEQWDCDAFALNGAESMTCDLRAGATRAPDPMDYMTKTTSVPAALPGAPVPRWRAFLDCVTNGDAELQSYLQRVAGYCLTGSVAEHALFFLYGTGANGKSVFVNTLVEIWGDYALTIGTDMLLASNVERHPTEVARLRGVRLAVGSEIEIGRTWAESKIKALTGGDRLQGRFMRQDFFEFDPQFKLMIVGNHKPSLRGVDEAIHRRLHLIPFTVTIPADDRDPDLSEKLKAEGPAILRWAIDGCLAWQREGLNPPAAVRDATATYLAAEDTFELWRDACTTVDPNGWESSAGLWGSWKRWAEAAGEFVGKQRSFAQLLEDRGLKPQRQAGTGARGYRGCRLQRPDYSEDPRYGG